MSAPPVRAFRPEDAPHVVAAFRRVYGDRYPHRVFSDPDALVRANAEGTVFSVVAVDPVANVVAHYALLRADRGPVAESGAAIVDVAFRHHGLLEAMRPLLEARGREIGLRGIVGQAVALHPFTQRMYDTFRAVPTGIELAVASALHPEGIATSDDRTSCVVYYASLMSRESAVVALPSAYARILTQTYEALGVLPVALPPSAPPAHGTLVVDPATEFGDVRIVASTAGRDSGDHLAEIVNAAAPGPAPMSIDIPLAQPGAPALAERARALGFVYAALIPGLALDGDVLRLQKLRAPIDLDALQIASDRTREVLKFIRGELGAPLPA